MQALHLLDDRAPVLRQVWPHATEWAYADAVAQVAGSDRVDELRGLVRRARTLDALAASPIVAVAGMLNAGKTSVVSRFLSARGRQRALRGLRSMEGTQRFVLWLPEAWRADAEIWPALQDHLREVFGASVELLADDPEQAHAQYRNTHTDADLFSVPLVATDPALDELGFAFLDCPDVQRRHGDADAGTLRGVRLEVLGKAAQLCSAFLVVATLDGVQDRTLHVILDQIAGRAPGVRRFLLLNKLRPDVPPHEALAELRELVGEHELASVFGAWDFAIDGHEHWVPERAVQPGYPAFYQLDADPGANPPHSAAEGRLLDDLGRLLPVSELHTDKARSMRVTLQGATRDATRRIVEAVARSRGTATTAQLGILAACRRAMVDPDGNLRVHVDQALLDAFVGSLERTAPVYVRVFMWLNKPLRALSKAVSEGWKAARAAFAPIDDVRERLVGEGRGQLVDADGLANALKGEDVDHLVSTDVHAAAAAALDRFVAEHRSHPDVAELDAATQALWDSMPFFRKATAAGAAVTSMVAGLVAVVMIPIDWGSSVFFAASVKELLAASMMGTALGMAMELPLRKALERQAGWPAFADLRALVCDELGVPRDALDGETWTVAFAGGEAPLPEPTVQRGVLPESPLAVLELDDGFRHALDEVTPG